ncbi:MAG: Lcl domain-containing protein [Sulfuricella sp.]
MILLSVHLGDADAAIQQDSEKPLAPRWRRRLFALEKGNKMNLPRLVYIARFLTITIFLSLAIWSGTASGFELDDQVKAVGTVNVRSSPTSSTTLGSEPDGSQGVIMNGTPQIAARNGTLYVWWYIQWNSGLLGWVAEDQGDLMPLVTTAWNDQIGSFNGVPAYSNGQTKNYFSYTDNKNTGIDTGDEWQCVEYINRYYYLIYGINLINNSGISGGPSANRYYGMAAALRLTAYQNGGTTAPKVGDILAFGGGANGNGHVAIIQDVGADYVEVIQQNVMEDQRDATFIYPLTVSGGNYSVDPAKLGSNYFTQGWLRKPMQGQTAAGTVDVQPLNVTLSSSNVAPGGSLTVSWQVRNNGTAVAGSSNSQVRITTSNSLNGYGGPTNDMGVPQATGPIAANGGVVDQSAMVTVPNAPGIYYLWVVADNSNPASLSQSDVSNDYAVSAAALTVAATTTSTSPTTTTTNTSPTTLGMDLVNNGDINWTQVSSAGKTFAIIKVSDGLPQTFIQPKYFSTCPNSPCYITAAKLAGLVVGPYHFARPYVNSAKDEADFFYSVAKDYIGPGYLPPALDIEDPPDDAPYNQVSQMDPAVLTQWILDWIAELQRLTGNPNLKPMIYTIKYFTHQWGIRPELAQYPLWIADYENPYDVNPATDGTLPFGPWNYSWTFLQYSVNGNSVSGVPVPPVDLDVFNGDITALNSLVGGGTPSTTAPGIPTNVSAAPGNAQATVNFTAPTNNGGSAITIYTVTSNPGGVTATGTTSPITVTGLTNNGTAYTFTVTATNSAGPSPASVASSSVTPSASVVTTYIVSTIAGANGGISPASQTVTQGHTASFTVSPNTGYKASASGCGGSLAGSTYTTGAITANCAVSATFTAIPVLLSACTAITPSAPSVTQGNSSPILTATCSYSPTAYIWKLNGTTIAGCTGSTCTIPAASLPTATTYSVTVTANNTNGTGTQTATATITVVPSVQAGTFPGTTLIDNGDGTVTDSTTGLTWMRCAMGQAWNGTTCTGTASAYLWNDAMALTSNFAGHSDWRMPSPWELQTVADLSLIYPAINSTIFPAALDSYWSVSSQLSNSANAWYVSFNVGYILAYDKASWYDNVRLVRGGQAVSTLTTPTADFADNGDGTVNHLKTGLTWMRCALGQTWDGTTCTGTASTYTWDQAVALTSSVAGHSDWRLPSEKELGSIVEYGANNPAINSTVFPATPPDNFWTATSHSYDPTFAWLVPFSGGVSNVGNKSGVSYVRLVRGGQSLGAFTLSVSKAGSGSGAVTSNPTHIDCGATCSANFNAAVGSVILSAASDTGSIFTGWSGACSGTGDCTVTMNAARGVVATFDSVAAIPDAPTIGTATPGNAQATVSFTAPVNTGSSAITGYTVTSNSGGVTATSTSIPITVTGLTNGTPYTFTVTATNSAGTGASSAASNSVIPGKSSQTVSFGAAPAIVVGGTGTVSAIATSGLAVSYSSTTPAVCAASGSTVTGMTAGACTIAANQAGNASYNAAAQVTQSITISKASQTVSFGTAPAIAVGGTGTVSAIATSGLAVIFSSTTPSVCTVSGSTVSGSTVSGSTVSGIAAGACSIAANQAGDTYYNPAATLTQNIMVAAPTTAPDAPTGVSATTAGNSQATVSFAAPANNGGAAIAGYTVTSSLGGITATGTTSPITVTGLTNGTAYTFTVTATNIAGTSAASAASGSVTPNGANQTISAINFSPATITNGGTTSVSATATSGLAVTFTSTTPSVCTVNGSTVTDITAGACIIAANQAGNAYYNAATQVTQNITIGSAPGITLNLEPSWNLVGNGVEAPITVATSFNDAAKVNTIWKWVTAGTTPGINYPAWAFYTPALNDGGQTYAASKGYDFLTTINAGEGFWVNAKIAFSISLPSGTAVQSSSFMPPVANPFTLGGAHALPQGWSLIATGDSPTPAQFDAAIVTFASTPPAAGSNGVYTNLTTLWAWDATNTSWYFWAPSLVNSGGLANYIGSKNYLDFATMATTPPGTLSPTTGFWVNMP